MKSHKNMCALNEEWHLHDHKSNNGGHCPPNHKVALAFSSSNKSRAFFDPTISINSELLPLYTFGREITKREKKTESTSSQDRQWVIADIAFLNNLAIFSVGPSIFLERKRAWRERQREERKGNSTRAIEMLLLLLTKSMLLLLIIVKPDATWSLK